MAVEWQSRDFLTDWTGLFNRRQSIDVPASYSRTARNVDFYGSAIGKRLGTQIVNGWGTLVSGPAWTSVGAGTASGTVVDASGFKVGDAVYFAAVPGGVEAHGTITAISGTTITLGSVLPSGYFPTPGMTAAYTRRDLGARIDGLYHAIFRSSSGFPDGVELLIAAAGSSLWNVWGQSVAGGASFQPLTIGQVLPQTTVGTTWADTLHGSFGWMETLVAVDHSTSGQPTPNASAAAPDIVQIQHGATTIYEGSIASFQSATSFTLTAAAAAIPQAGDQVIFFPHRTPGDTRFTMLNNRVFVTSAAAKNPIASGPGLQPVQRMPPTVLDPDTVLGGVPAGAVMERRMGIRAPTTPAGPVVTIGGVLTGDYAWRFTFVNSKTGQESEASPVIASPQLTLSAQQVTVQVYRSPDPQVDQINLYRTLSGQDGSWYFVASGPNTTAPIDDNTPDEGLGVLLKTFSNEPPPDTTSMLAVWTLAGALIGIDSGSIAEGGEDVIWSDAPDIVNNVYKIESFPVNNTLFVNRDDGDHLVSLGVFFDSVVVWKGRSMHRIVGAPPDIILQPISFRDDHTGVGIWSAKGFIMDTDVAIFVSDDGFYQVSRYEGVQQGFTSTRVSRAIDQEFRFRTSQLSSAQRQFRERSHLLYHRVKRRLQAFVPVDGNPDPTDMFVFQAEGTVQGTPHGWSLWSVPTDYTDVVGNPAPAQSYISASCMVHSALGMDFPHYGLGPRGLVLKADTGAGDWQGFPVTITSDTVWFSGGGAGTVCRCRAVDFVFIPTAGLPAPILRVGTDFNVSDVNTTSRYQLPQLGALGVPANENPLILDLGQYLSIGVEETSITGLFLVEDFTLWFQRLPVGVTPRLIPVPIAPTEF